MFIISTRGNSSLARFAPYFASGQSTNCSVLSLRIKTPLPCGQNTQELALAFGVLGSTTLGLDTLHLKIKPRNKIIWPTLVQKMSIINMGCLQLVFQILWLFYLVWEVTMAATILSYLTQYMSYVPLQTKHEFCVCVCVCVRAHARVRVCVYVRKMIFEIPSIIVKLQKCDCSTFHIQWNSLKTSPIKKSSHLWCHGKKRQISLS